jgi:hypothetical protein
MEAKEAQSENIEKNPLTAGSQMKQLRSFVGWGLDDTDHRCTLPMPSVAAGLSCAGPVALLALSQIVPNLRREESRRGKPGGSRHIGDRVPLIVR